MYLHSKKMYLRVSPLKKVYIPISPQKKSVSSCFFMFLISCRLYFRCPYFEYEFHYDWNSTQYLHIHTRFRPQNTIFFYLELCHNSPLSPHVFIEGKWLPVSNITRPLCFMIRTNSDINSQYKQKKTIFI